MKCPPSWELHRACLLVGHSGGHCCAGSVEKHPRFRPEAVEVLGEAALSIFIVVAMANLDWAQVGAYWLPMVTVVPFQVAAVVMFTSYVTFR